MCIAKIWTWLRFTSYYLTTEWPDKMFLKKTTWHRWSIYSCILCDVDSTQIMVIADGLCYTVWLNIDKDGVIKLRQGDAYMRQRTGSSLDQIMAHCQVIIWIKDNLLSIGPLRLVMYWGYKNYLEPYCTGATNKIKCIILIKSRFTTQCSKIYEFEC